MTRNLTLLTDLYQLTMMNGYYLKGRHEKTAVFDVFFRQNDLITYSLAAGLEQVVDYINNISFGKEEIDYLLRYDNPLELLCSYWPECSLYGEDVIETLMDDISTPPEERREQPASLRERLQQAAHEVKDRPAPDKPDRGGEAR